MPVITLTDQNFNDEVTHSHLPVVVDFWAPWCGPCRTLGPIMEELAADYQGRIKIGKLNVDENAVTPGSFNVMGIPTIVFFANGREVKRVVGAREKADFEREFGLDGKEAGGS
jgi:thioredoxin 1